MIIISSEESAEITSDHLNKYDISFYGFTLFAIIPLIGIIFNSIFPNSLWVFLPPLSTILLGYLTYELRLLFTSEISHRPLGKPNLYYWFLFIGFIHLIYIYFANAFFDLSIPGFDLSIRVGTNESIELFSKIAIDLRFQFLLLLVIFFPMNVIFLGVSRKFDSWIKTHPYYFMVRLKPSLFLLIIINLVISGLVLFFTYNQILAVDKFLELLNQGSLGYKHVPILQELRNRINGLELLDRAIHFALIIQIPVQFYFGINMAIIFGIKRKIVIPKESPIFDPKSIPRIEKELFQKVQNIDSTSVDNRKWIRWIEEQKSIYKEDQIDKNQYLESLRKFDAFLRRNGIVTEIRLLCSKCGKEYESWYIKCTFCSYQNGI
ncbi:MAG: hypothetical protein ACW964_01330 [Candidatus Hodarchaeales archaeon]